MRNNMINKKEIIILVLAAFVGISLAYTCRLEAAEYVCNRHAGCELFPEAKTQAEYCPTCIWVDEKKEVVLPTSTRSIKRKNRKYERTVCDHWSPITSDGPLVCRTVVSSN